MQILGDVQRLERRVRDDLGEPDPVGDRANEDVADEVEGGRRGSAQGGGRPEVEEDGRARREVRVVERERSTLPVVPLRGRGRQDRVDELKVVELGEEVGRRSCEDPTRLTSLRLRYAEAQSPQMRKNPRREDLLDVLGRSFEGGGQGELDESVRRDCQNALEVQCTVVDDESTELCALDGSVSTLFGRSAWTKERRVGRTAQRPT